jgi:ribonuclease D
LTRLKKWRLQRAREKGVESDVVLPRDLLEEIAKVNPHSDQELSQIMHDMPERFNLYHAFIMDTLKERQP